MEALADRVGPVFSDAWEVITQRITDTYEAEQESQRRIGAADPEARQWLRENGQEAPLASNRFDAEDAIAFVEEVYAAGAERVVFASESIRDDEHELSQGGPCADTLKVQLPRSPVRRRALFAIAAREVDDEGYDADPDNGQDLLVFWWD